MRFHFCECLSALFLVLFPAHIVCGADNSLDALIRATQAHEDLIVSGKGQYSYQQASRSGSEASTTRITGAWYLHKNRLHLALERTIDEHGAVDTSREEYESTREHTLHITHHKRLASASARPNPGAPHDNFHLPGIRECDVFGNALQEQVKGLQENGYSIRVANVPGSSTIELQYERPLPTGGKGVIRIDPARQYSLISVEYLSVVQDKPYIERANVKMQYIDPPGIWFPQEADYYYQCMDTTISRRWTFSGVELNVPIAEEELAAVLPAGYRLTDGYMGGGSYVTSRALKLSDIVTGQAAVAEGKARPQTQLPTGNLVEMLMPSAPSCTPAVVRGESLEIEETTYDFGPVEPMPGRKISHTFTLKNVGAASVHFIRVYQSDLNSTASLDRSELPPGESVHLLFEIDPSRRGIRGNGVFDIVVYTDDPKLKEAEFQVRARFLAPLECQPREIRLGRVKKGETFRRMVSMTGLGRLALYVRGGRASAPNFRVLEILERPRNYETNRMAILEIKAEGDGFTSGTVCFYTDDPTLNEACVTISYDTAPEPVVLVKPASVFLSANPKGQIEGPPRARYKTALDCLRLEVTQGSGGNSGGAGGGQSLCRYAVDADALRNQPYGLIGSIEVIDAAGQPVAAVSVFR